MLARTASRLLSLPLLASPLAAQEVIVAETYVEETGQSSEVPFTRVVAGHLTGHHSPDIVGLSGTSPRMAVAPQLFKVSVSLGIAANDLAIVPAAAAGGLDSVAFVGEDGLSTWKWDTTTNSADVDLVDGGSAWEGATMLRVAKLGAATGPWGFVGVDSDETKLLLKASPSATTTEVDLGETILSIATLNYDAHAGADVAIVTDCGLRIRSSDGGWALPLVSQCTSTDPRDTVIAVRNASGTDKLAWITPGSQTGYQDLRVVQRTGTSTNTWDTPISLGIIGVVACAANDQTGDGRDELLVSHRYSSDLYILTNLNGSGATFSNNPAYNWSMPWGTGTPSAHSAWPALVDWDGDGDQDVAFAADGSPRFILMRNPFVNERLYRVKTGSSQQGYVAGSGSQQVEKLTVMVLTPPEVPAAATHVELVAWKQAVFMGDFDPEPLSRVLVPVPATIPAVDTTLVANVEVPFTAPVPTADTVVTLQIRFVEMPDTEIERAYPAFFGSFAASTGTFTLLQEMFDTNGFNSTVLNPITAVPPPPGSTTIANDPILARGTVPRPKLDPFDPPTVPQTMAPMSSN